MGLILGHSGLGYKGVSFVPDDFSTPLFRCTYSVSVDDSFNGKYINNKFPSSIYQAGQVTLLSGNNVVYHEYINHFSRDLGFFSASVNYQQYVNIYKFPYCRDELTDPPGTPEFYEYFKSVKPTGWEQHPIMVKVYRARYPDATEEEILAMVDCDVHQYIGEVNPVKLGMLRWINTVKVEIFSPGVDILVQLIDG